MELFTLLLIAAGLSMDAFAVALINGLCASESRIRYALRVGLFFGFFLPGDSLLVTCGALAALPTSPFNIWVLLPLLGFAAVFGDNVGYWFGRKTGPRIFSRAALAASSGDRDGFFCRTSAT